jgi:hypothetical protein
MTARTKNAARIAPDGVEIGGGAMKRRPFS